MGDGRKIFEFGGENVDVSWDGRLCIHVGECTRAKGDTIGTFQRPRLLRPISWVQRVRLLAQ